MKAKKFLIASNDLGSQGIRQNMEVHKLLIIFYRYCNWNWYFMFFLEVFLPFVLHIYVI